MLSQLIDSQSLAQFPMMNRTTPLQDRRSSRPKSVSQGSHLRHRFTRTVGSRLSLPTSPRCFLESKPLLHNRREEANLAAPLIKNIVCTRGASDDLCTNEFYTNVHLCITVQTSSNFCMWKRHRQRTSSSTTSEFDTLGAPMAFHDNFEHHQLDCAEPVPTAQQHSSPD